MPEELVEGDDRGSSRNTKCRSSRDKDCICVEYENEDGDDEEYCCSVKTPKRVFLKVQCFLCINSFRTSLAAGEEIAATPAARTTTTATAMAGTASRFPSGSSDPAEAAKSGVSFRRVN